MLKEPAEAGVTTITTVALALLARLPIVQVTAVAPLHEPCDGVEETKVTPPGSVSVGVTLVAGAGPLLVMVIV